MICGPAVNITSFVRLEGVNVEINIVEREFSPKISVSASFGWRGASYLRFPMSRVSSPVVFCQVNVRRIV